MSRGTRCTVEDRETKTPGGTGTIRVGLFTDASYTGGAERYLHLLAGGLGSHGFVPVLITGGGVAALQESARRNGHEVVEIPFGGARNPKGLLSLARALGKLDISIFHINLAGPFDAGYGIAAPLARLAGIRRVVTTEHLPMVPTFAKARLIRNFTNRFVDLTITVSRDNVGHLVRNHGVKAERIRVVYNGIPDTGGAPAVDMRDELSLAGDAYLLAVAGALEKRKGHLMLFDAMRSLPDRIHLFVAGEGRDEAEYRRMVSEYNLERRVHFLGHRGDIPGILRGIDQIIVPSTLEATPYVILEAMAAGVPVVASDIYGIPELVSADESGLLVRPGDESALRESIVRIMEHPELARRMGRAGRERYERHFTIERSVRETVDIYRELLR